MTPQASPLPLFGVGAARSRRYRLGSAGCRLDILIGAKLGIMAFTTSFGMAAVAIPNTAQAQTVGEQSVAQPAPNAAVNNAATTPVPVAPVETKVEAVPEAKDAVPVAPETATAPEPKTATVVAPPLAKPVETEPLLTEDELSVAGYMPGYRRYDGLGLSPHVPRVGGLPGGITPSFGAPNRADDWTFRWTGSMNISLQASSNTRRRLAPGQGSTVYHTPPMTIEEWASFTSTSSVPGNWVGMTFQYGNSKVTAITSIDTYNPTQPTTYYQMGSQYFINNSYLSISPGSIGGIRFHVDAGFYSKAYGNLSRYGGGVYTNPITGLIRGVGEAISAEYDLSDKVTLKLEHGLMTARNGWIANNIISSPINGYNRTTWPAAWIHHGHAGFLVKGDTQYELQLHYIHNWSQDERVEWSFDNPVTRQLNETNIPDGRIQVFGMDARAIDDVYGYLSAGVAFVRMNHAFPLKGLMTYGGDGENIADRWLGLPANGTGSVVVAAVNYTVSLGKIVAHPQAFNGDGPDIIINTGFHWATSLVDYKKTLWGDESNWNHRNRYKGAIDGLYTLFRYLGVGCRFDTVVPNSKDMDETFYVLAPRIQLKTDWTSREALNLMYARWFYGSKTRNEGTGERTPERLDNQLLALNFNLWW